MRAQPVIGILFGALAASVSFGLLGLALLPTAGASPVVAPPSQSGAQGPEPPTGVVAQAVGSTRIEVSWNRSGEAHSYRVYRNGTRIAEVEGTRYTDNSLTPSTTYRYRISTVNPAGKEGEKSEEAVATTHAAATGGDDDDGDGDDDGDDPDPPPDSEEPDDAEPDDDQSGDPDPGASGAPTDIRAEAVGSSRVDLSWAGRSDAVRYFVYRDGSRVEETTSTTFSDRGVVPATRYRYQVSAANGRGQESPRSAEVAVTTPRPEGVPPAPPTGLRIAP